MRKKLGVQLAVADLFTAPTIEALATKISVLQTLGSPSGVTASGKPRQGTYGSYGWMLYLFCDLLLDGLVLYFFEFPLDSTHSFLFLTLSYYFSSSTSTSISIPASLYIYYLSLSAPQTGIPYTHTCT